MSSRRRIAWLVPSLIEGSGGHRTILQNVDALIDAGHDCDVYLEPEPGQSSDAAAIEDARRKLTRFFGGTRANIHVGFDITEPYDLAFATAWYTARVVNDLACVKRKAYFVQDFEAYFNPMGDGFLLAVNSYRFGLTPITIGRWLTAKLHREFGTPGRHFDFCADLDAYRPRPDAPPRERAVCFIFQPEKPRRCARIGVEALGVLKHWAPDVKVYLYGSRTPMDLWFEHENLGLLPVERCAALYHRCQAGLCISSTNPSRIPFEMMAAGLPVVDIHGENNLYDMPDDGVLLAEARPESIARAMLAILDDAPRRAAMSQFGERFMRDKPLSAGFAQFVDAAGALLEDRFVGETSLAPTYTRPAFAMHGAGAAAHRPAAADAALARQSSAVAELEQIYASRAWRTLQSLKRIWPYPLIARWRWGPDWDKPAPDADAAQRLARVKSSRAYRLILAAKRTALYRWFARRKYGTT